MPSHHTDWAKIRANRELQNDRNPWRDPCALCGHEKRHHRSDWFDPMSELAPECGFTVTVIDPDTLDKQTAPCPCSGFIPPRASSE